MHSPARGGPDERDVDDVDPEPPLAAQPLEVESEVVRAAVDGRFAVVKERIRSGSCPVDAVDEDLTTVLTAAAFCTLAPADDVADALVFLLDAGADATLANNIAGWTPWVAACYAGNPAAVALLLGAVAPDVASRAPGGALAGRPGRRVLPPSALLGHMDSGGKVGLQLTAETIAGLRQDIDDGFVYTNQTRAFAAAREAAADLGVVWGDEEKRNFVANAPEPDEEDMSCSAELSQHLAIAELVAAALGLSSGALLADPRGASALPVRPVRDWVHFMGGATRRALVEWAGLPPDVASAPLLPSGASPPPRSAARRVTTHGRSVATPAGRGRRGGGEGGAGAGAGATPRAGAGARDGRLSGAAATGVTTRRRATASARAPAAAPRTPPLSPATRAVAVKPAAAGAGAPAPACSPAWAAVPVVYLAVLLLSRAYGWTFD